VRKHSVAWLLLLFAVSAIPAYGQALYKSGASDQSSVSVTVYNSNLGLIKDVRKIQLPIGQGELRFMDVAAHIKPVTVHAKSKNANELFSVLEQNYEYDLMNESKLLDKYVGREVKLIDWNKFQDRKDTVSATLLSNNGGQVFLIGDEIYLGHPGVKVLPEVPENLIAKPTLMWLYHNQFNSPHELEVSYLTDNLNWKADYVLVLGKMDKTGDLSGWVTVDNKSGATYENAALKLVAGDIHRVQKERVVREYSRNVVAYDAVSAQQFQEQSFFEYHIYDLQRKTTIKDNQTKQIRLLEASGFSLEKELIVYGAQHYFTRKYHEDQEKQSVNVYIKLRNSESNELGMPLPAGIVRVYKKDDSNSVQFLGEDQIQHTPKGEEVRLRIGKAFDVVAERRQLDYQRKTNKLHESEWEITLRNHKAEPISVGILEPIYGNWSVISSSHPHAKKDAFTIRFDVEVPADGEVKVTYRIAVGL
jgi:hypothetical protein